LIRVLSVLGTRPEAIKLAPVVRALAARPGEFESLVCSTGQHREMLDQVFETFGLAPDRELALMRDSQRPSELTARILQTLPSVLHELRPDLVLVQGDTMTAFAAAFCAHLERIAVGHVEAGLRTGDRFNPFPEEMNRRLVTPIARIHFAPTGPARDALLAEGVDPSTIHLTGNTAIDALQLTLRADYRFCDSRLAALDPSRRLVLVTTHRRESFGAPLQSICRALRELTLAREDCDFVLPMHPNPIVRETLRATLAGLPRMHLIEPVEYREFCHLMARAHLILTDSGGIQEEAPALDVPVLVMRETTERPEGVRAGCAVLVGTGSRIVDAALELLDDRAVYRRMALAPNPYGDGKAALRIADAISEGSWSD
jgi:UDP-N-acetylglucosamine 2-epimerase (non-hydrolysing)